MHSAWENWKGTLLLYSQKKKRLPTHMCPSPECQTCCGEGESQLPGTLSKWRAPSLSGNAPEDVNKRLRDIVFVKEKYDDGSEPPAKRKRIQGARLSEVFEKKVTVRNYGLEHSRKLFEVAMTTVVYGRRRMEKEKSEKARHGSSQDPQKCSFILGTCRAVRALALLLLYNKLTHKFAEEKACLGNRNEIRQRTYWNLICENTESFGIFVITAAYAHGRAKPPLKPLAY